MTKIIAISDTHTHHSELSLPEGDILVHCGDSTFVGKWYEWCSFLKWLGEQSKKFKHVIFIAGNHDFYTGHFIPDVYRNGIANIHYLEDSGMELEGIKFWGTPWTTQFGNWNFMEEEEELAKKWQLIPQNTDFLITHGPPHTILDKNMEGVNCGSITLYNRVKELNVKYHCFGHIHEGYGKEKIENTVFCNCSVLNRHYKLQNSPIVIEIN